MRAQQPPPQVPWIVFGDFNQTINVSDRSNTGRSPDRAFVSLIASLDLIDLPLQGRQYTWSRGNDRPTFVRLDRFLISNSWSSKFPNSSQTALHSILSDHCPLLCQVSSDFPKPNTFRFENYWLKMSGFHDLVRTNWQAMPTATTPGELSTKLQSLRTEIRKWNITNVGMIDAQADTCSRSLMWLTLAEESRQLSNLERLLQALLTDRLIQIEDQLEVKWRQRAKRQWLKEGDRNTKFFHAVASQQKRSNTIASIIQNGEELTQHNTKAQAFFEYFSGLIGAHSPQTVNFDLEAIYSSARLSQTDIDALQIPWTDQDILQAINSWKSNKSPGPDGFTGEFYNAFSHDVLPDLKEVFNRLNSQPHESLFPLNDSFIVLVPKKQPATAPTDFRPISLVNAVQKIYSRILAGKIKPLLNSLLSPNQTGFLKDRSILQGFYYAQQVIQAATKQKAQVAIFKADVFKAFDTLNWDFLAQSLRARAFPQRCIQWIQNNILQGSSRVIINSVAGKKITLKRGVRQRDPISPYLFNLAIDFLPR